METHYPIQMKVQIIIVGAIVALFFIISALVAISNDAERQAHEAEIQHSQQGY
jgi:hypothetical protein